MIYKDVTHNVYEMINAEYVRWLEEKLFEIHKLVRGSMKWDKNGFSIEMYVKQHTKLTIKCAAANQNWWKEQKKIG